jgi:hypothetical protein
MMRAIRPIVSAAMLAVLLTASEGLAVSLHWCCGTVESLALYRSADACCCSDDATDKCRVTGSDECCTTASVYLLLPIGAPRPDKATPVALPAAPSVHLLSLASLPTAVVGIPHPIAADIESRSSPPILQRFRL